MDSINSWINEDEVRKLAEELTSTPKDLAKLEEDNDDTSKDFAESLKPKNIVKPSQSSIEEILNEKENDFDGSVRIPNELKAEKALRQANPDELIIPKAIKEEKVLSLAKASVMAASLGLIKEKSSSEADTVTLCDSALHTVPADLDIRERTPTSAIEVHSEKGIGTFEEIDSKLSSLVSANGVCVIDRDGDVLYSSLKNEKLVSFTIEAMASSKLMLTKEGEVGTVRLKLMADNFIEFVAVKSTRGVLVLSMVLKDALGKLKVKEVADQMLRIANEA